MQPNSLSAETWSQHIARCGGLACLWEATASKPGNVHRGADFEDLTYLDFATSALVIGPAIAAGAQGKRIGRCVKMAVSATRQAVGTNTNLGMLLLMVPLAKVPQETPLASGIAGVLSSLDAADAADVYEAIRLASPGGLGKVEEADVSGPPPDDLRHAMRLAADRDLIARQYTNDFADVFTNVVPHLAAGVQAGWPLSTTIIDAHLRLMRQFPDSLIARKCGPQIAGQAAALAQRVIDAGPPGDGAYQEALGDLDFWLRSDGHRRNPGTTADLITAGLFAALREGIIELPVRFYS